MSFSANCAEREVPRIPLHAHCENSPPTSAPRSANRDAMQEAPHLIERMAGSCGPMAFDSQSAMASKSPSSPW
jgi:hypothetical protein